MVWRNSLSWKQELSEMKTVLFLCQNCVLKLNLEVSLDFGVLLAERRQRIRYAMFWTAGTNESFSPRLRMVFHTSIPLWIDTG
jgi:hypothetical protein